MSTDFRYSIQDASGDGRSFVIGDLEGRALVFGLTGNVRLDADGVLPAHLVVLPRNGVLLAASASRDNPARVNGRPLPREWTPLPVPCRIVAGAATIEIGLEIEPRDSVPVRSAPAMRRAARVGLGAAARVAAQRICDDYRRLPRARRALCVVGVVLAALAMAHVAGASEPRAMRRGARSDAASGAERVSSSTAAASSTSGSRSERAEAAPPHAASSAPVLAAAASATERAPDLLGATPASRPGPARRAALTPSERKSYRIAVKALLVGDLETADRLVEPLTRAHPEADDLSALRRVLAAKARVGR